ncbi:MAG TPA: inner membrane CreD family protein [Planctomycetota bacterium]|nr:inner membrane CreD family protein [Planctomycetota bacterium]
MSFVRVLAIGGVYLLACGGWMLLGTTTMMRSDQLSGSLGADVRRLWGGPLVQEAPDFSVKIPGGEQSRKVFPVANRVKVELGLEHRRRGLNWYPTYNCDFSGEYTLFNHEEVAQKVRMHFKFPALDGTYDHFSFRLDGKVVTLPVDPSQGISEIIEVAPGQKRVVAVRYRTRGLGEWRYKPAGAGRQVQDLDLSVTTNFAAVDFPDGALSPMKKESAGEGMILTWQAGDLITNQDIGVIMPDKLNPGPLSARITFFAPVCLLFFFLVVGTIGILRGIGIHPMHYLFVAGGFFAFHLLFAYLVDHVPVHGSFAIAAVATVLLVTGYLAAALGRGFPWKLAAAGQFFYLILFSYSFFLKGMTGLTVTVGAVLTLGILMWVTARIDWFAFFGRPKPAAPDGAPRPPVARRVAEDGGMLSAGG